MQSNKPAAPERSTPEHSPKVLYTAMKNWRADDQPRERLVKHGAASLSDAELLAILIKNGAQGISALDIGRTLLRHFSSLTDIAARDIAELRTFRGMGEVKAITLAAAFEIARRLQSEPFSGKPTIRLPQDVANIYIPQLRGARQERFYVLLLNTANQIFREIVISEGSLNASIVHPREVFRLAVIESAASIILLHNHPSGNTEPSKQDIEITQQLVAAGSMLGIPVHDHIIVAGEAFSSLRQLQKM